MSRDARLKDILKLSYRSKSIKRTKPVTNLDVELLDKVRISEDHDFPGSNTEMGGRGIQVPGVSSDNYNTGGTDPDKYEEGLESMHPSSGQDLDERIFDMLVDLGDGLDKREEYRMANFADFLIKKFAKTNDLEGEYLYRKLMTRISTADIPNTNDILKKLTAIFSRTVISEYDNHNDLEKAKKSAYKKILHRAQQYLSED